MSANTVEMIFLMALSLLSQTMTEYYQYTSEEFKAMTKAWEEERKQKKAEEEARRKEAEPILKHIEAAIMDLVREENE